jgi:hypothetical protein
LAITFSRLVAGDDGKRIHVTETATASGKYSSLSDTHNLARSPPAASAQPPNNGTAWMDGLVGYDSGFMPGAALNSAKAKIFPRGAAAGAFPAGHGHESPVEHSCIARQAPQQGTRFTLKSVAPAAPSRSEAA